MEHHSTHRMLMVILLAAMAASSINCGKQDPQKMNTDFTSFVSTFENKVAPLNTRANLAAFDASISGKDEDYTRSADLQVQVNTLFAQKDDFAKLRTFRESGAITDPLKKRQLDVLYNAFLAKQLDEKKIEDLIRMQNDIEKKFSTFRAQVGGKSLTDNEIEDVLKTSTDSDTLREAWLASKNVGVIVAPEILALVKKRNEAARELGFKNYHAMQLELSEQNPDDIENLFDELDTLTRNAFALVKREMDDVLARRYGITKGQLRPWHYQNRFFQEAPKIYGVDLDAFYKNKDIVALTKQYYASIGLPINDLVAKSDLFEKPGKYQHAYCSDIDRNGDVRVVCNIKPSYNWMNTSLHEFGHAVYSKYLDRSLPWILREEAHTFTTEAIAMMFGRFASNPAWMTEVAGIPAEQIRHAAPEIEKSLRLEQLVFSRWAQVMYRFEKAMYENPDRDLNTLWWDLVEKYQLLHRPEGHTAPDWASKIHVALYPAYYHNYLMGELLASQLFSYINRVVLKNADPKAQSFNGKPEVGTYLVNAVFKPAKTLPWNDMIEKATGEKLTAKYYAKQFIE